MNRNLSYPIVFTHLGLEINAAVDRGSSLPIEDLHEHIENKTLWKHLEKEFKIIVLCNKEQKEEMLIFFKDLAHMTDHEREYNIQKNGLCLLIAYLYDAINSENNEDAFPSLFRNSQK